MPRLHVPAIGWISCLQAGLTGAVVNGHNFYTSAAHSPYTGQELSEGLSYLRDGSLGTAEDEGVKETR